jgi:hypothetical protein
MTLMSTRTLIGTEQEICGAGEQESWGQPPAGCHYFVTIDGKVYGHLVTGSHISSGSGVSANDVLLYEAEPMYEEEPEDAIIAGSGILPRLMAQARQERPSSDWKRDLYDM